MAAITVRKIDDEVIRDLRISAAKRGVSMEQEARDRLRQPIREMSAGVTGAEAQDNGLDALTEEILAFGRRLPKRDFDLKQASDDLYDYLDRE